MSGSTSPPTSTRGSSSSRDRCPSRPAARSTADRCERRRRVGQAMVPSKTTQALRRPRRNMLVQYEQPNPHVALIRLHRPEKMNAFSIALERELLAALQRACGDEEVRVVIFAGSGKAFSGGGDLAESDLTDPEHHPLSGRAGRHTWREVVRPLRRPDKVFIAAVHGWAAGQGVELCVLSDLVVCDETARSLRTQSST